MDVLFLDQRNSETFWKLHSELLHRPKKNVFYEKTAQGEAQQKISRQNVGFAIVIYACLDSRLRAADILMGILGTPPQSYPPPGIRG